MYKIFKDIADSHVSELQSKLTFLQAENEEVEISVDDMNWLVIQLRRGVIV